MYHCPLIGSQSTLFFEFLNFRKSGVLIETMGLGITLICRGLYPIFIIVFWRALSSVFSLLGNTGRQSPRLNKHLFQNLDFFGLGVFFKKNTRLVFIFPGLSIFAGDK